MSSTTLVTDTLDAHMWLENADGEVVFDPHFIQYDIIKRVQNLKGEKKYKAWIGKKRGVALNKIQEINTAKIKALPSIGWTKKQFWEHFSKNPHFGNCFNNATAYWKKNQHLKIVIGSMGWEKTNGDGVWWEYG